MTSLSTNQELRKGDSIRSINRKFTANYQVDGNFVINKADGTPTWASGTAGRDSFRILLQEDGNLVMYNASNKGVWHTDTWGNNSPKMRLSLSDDGHLLLDADGKNIWSSARSTGMLI